MLFHKTTNLELQLIGYHMSDYRQMLIKEKKNKMLN